MSTVSQPGFVSAPQTALRKELVPMKKNLRCLYEAKQEHDDVTVHIKVSTKGRTELSRTLRPWNTNREAVPMNWL